MSRSGILLVDRNQRNVELLSEFLRDAGYATVGASSLQELDTLLERLGHSSIVFGVIDIGGFGAEVWERCKHLYETGVAFVVVAKLQTSDAAAALVGRSGRAGARHVLTKPLRKEHLLTLIKIFTGEA